MSSKDFYQARLNSSIASLSELEEFSDEDDDFFESLQNSPNSTTTTTTTTTTSTTSTTNSTSSKNSHPSPTQSSNSKRPKKSLLWRAKKNFTSSVASSSLGKKAISRVIDEDARAVIHAVKVLFSTFEGKESAEKLERNIIRIAVKNYWLVKKGLVDPEEMKKLNEPTHTALKLLINTYDYLVDKASDEFVYQRMIMFGEQSQKVCEGLVKLVSEHLTSHSIYRIEQTFSYLSNPDLLMKIIKNKDLRNEVDIIIDEIGTYVDD